MKIGAAMKKRVGNLASYTFRSACFVLPWFLLFVVITASTTKIHKLADYCVKMSTENMAALTRCSNNLDTCINTCTKLLILQ